MARIRDLKPGFFRNEDLAKLPHWVRLLFQGLWGLADRNGCLEDRPKRISADVFPYEELPVTDGLDALQLSGFIRRYTVAGKAYIHVIEFKKHQKPHPKEVVSCPDPPPVPAEPEKGAAEPTMVEQPYPAQPGSSLAFGLVGSLASLGMGVPSTTGAEAPDDKPVSPIDGVKAPPDPIFGHALAFLLGKGVKERGARSFLGAMRKKHGDVRLAELIAKAEREDVSDPLAWISAAANPRASPAQDSKAMQTLKQLHQLASGGSNGSGVVPEIGYDGPREAGLFGA